mgnify:CR=1 FL=1
MPPVATSYVCTIDAAQAVVLQGLMAGRGWVFDDMPYARWRGRLGKTTVVAYESGKLTVQGRETAEFVQFLLEPEILHEARFGYEAVLAEVESPEQFGPHAGIDESGKGDYFGPLVVACAYTDEASAKTLLQAGVADSKTIKSDKKIAVLADLIRRECADRSEHADGGVRAQGDEGAGAQRPAVPRSGDERRLAHANGRRGHLGARSRPVARRA